MNERVFSSRRFRALRACVVTAAACALTLTGLYVATPSAQAENDKVDLSVDVRDRDASGAPKTSYWSGESVSPVVRFSASGTALSISGATLTVCATALPYENMGEVPEDAPQLTPSTVAESSTRYVIYDGQRLDYVPGKKYGIDAKTWSYHSGDQWCIDYRYAEIKGGMLGGFPVPFTFRNGVTPNGTTRTITAVLKESDGKIRIQDSLTLTARSSSDFTSGMLFEGAAWSETLSDGRTVPNFPYDAIGERQKTHTPHYFFTESIRHAVFADPATDSSAPAGTGAFDATTIRYLVKLPVGATINKSAHLGFGEWVLDPIAHTATWEGPADEWPRGDVCPNHRYCRPITINMHDVPVYTDPVNKVKSTRFPRSSHSILDFPQNAFCLNIVPNLFSIRARLKMDDSATALILKGTGVIIRSPTATEAIRNTAPLWIPSCKQKTYSYGVCTWVIPTPIFLPEVRLPLPDRDFTRK